MTLSRYPTAEEIKAIRKYAREAALPFSFHVGDRLVTVRLEADRRGATHYAARTGALAIASGPSPMLAACNAAFVLRRAHERERALDMRLGGVVSS